jgi:hypothetical protein
MKLELTVNAFREIIKSYNCYDSSVNINPQGIPSGALITIDHYGDNEGDGHYAITIYRDHLFNAAVLTARKDKFIYSDAMTGNYPIQKYDVTNWSPEKLADMQIKVRERLEKYNAMSARLKELTKIYNDALEAQRQNILQTVTS